MIICFECSQIIKNKLDQLIKHGEYEDYSQAIASAIENLEMLHREIAGKGSLVIESKQDSSLSSSDSLQGNGLKDVLPIRPGGAKPEKEKPTIPDLFQKRDMEKPHNFAPISGYLPCITGCCQQRPIAGRWLKCRLTLTEVCLTIMQDPKSHRSLLS